MKLPFVMNVTKTIQIKHWICFNTFNHVKFILYNCCNDLLPFNQNNYFNKENMVMKYTLYYLTVQVNYGKIWFCMRI